MTSLASPFRRLLARICAPALATAQGSSRTSLTFKYEPETDLLLARFGDPQDADTIVLEPDVTVRISRGSGEPVAIEVIDCAAKFHKQPSAITSAFARELLARYGGEARQRRIESTMRQAAHA